MTGQFATLARYNRWANRRLYDACAGLSAADYHGARPAFFGSIHATLNHILVGDRVWLGRLTGTAAGITALDQILHPDLAGLRAARAAEDDRIIGLVDAMDAAELDRVLDYQSFVSGPQRTSRRWALTHLFNHQTHHRGQVHDMLSQTPVPPPPLDLILFLVGGPIADTSRSPAADPNRPAATRPADTQEKMGSE